MLHFFLSRSFGKCILPDLICFFYYLLPKYSLPDTETEAAERRQKVGKVFYFYLTCQRKDGDILETSNSNEYDCSVNKR